MKNLRDFINESVSFQVNEAFGNPVLTEFFAGTEFSKNPMLKKSLTWDKIDETDCELMDPEEARKLAYKRNSTDYLVWKVGKKVAYSIGMIVYNRSIIKNDDLIVFTVKAMSKIATGVMLIHNHNKYSTIELAKLRQEQKKNALALQSDWTVQQANISRYEELKAANKNKVISRLDVVQRFEDLRDRYVAVLTTVTDQDVIMNAAIDTIVVTKITNLSLRFKSLLETMNQWLRYDSGDTIDKDWQERMKINRFKGFEDLCRDCERLIEQFE